MLEGLAFPCLNHASQLLSSAAGQHQLTCVLGLSSLHRGAWQEASLEPPTATGQHPGSKVSCCPREQGDGTGSTLEDCCFSYNLAIITETNSRPVHPLHSPSNDHTITLLCLKGNSADALLHLPKHHSLTSGNLCSGSSLGPTGERACESALVIRNTSLEHLPSPVTS